MLHRKYLEPAASRVCFQPYGIHRPVCRCPLPGWSSASAGSGGSKGSSFVCAAGPTSVSSVVGTSYPSLMITLFSTAGDSKRRSCFQATPIALIAWELGLTTWSSKVHNKKKVCVCVCMCVYIYALMFSTLALCRSRFVVDPLG